MPAALVPDDRIPELAAQIDSPAMLRVLRRLREVGFMQNGADVDDETIAILQRLTTLGLADPGYDGPTHGKPFIWVSNGNGQRVLKYFETSPQHEAALESKLTIHPRAHTALASLPEKDQLAVLDAAEALQTGDPTSWPREKVDRLSPDKPVFLLRVSPELRAFIRVADSGGIELFDIVREETLRLFLERYRAGSRVG
ncbi:MAG TPA: hypothetical protein VG013_24565 [Gemmataceae bacterium]|jgi:hypothetical protein|nr:hypothetical protein [Gemmataceae bacterium]